MSNNVAEISRDGVLQRVLRDNSLAALMLVLVMVTMINGIIIGMGIAALDNQGEKYDALRVQYEINGTWTSRLIGILEREGIEIPQPEEVEK